MGDGDVLNLDLSDEVMELLEKVRQGTPVELAGLEIGWLPAKTRSVIARLDLGELIAEAAQLADDSVVRALYRKAQSGNMTAIQMVLMNRRPREWRDVRKVEITGNVTVSTAEQIELDMARVRAILAEVGPEALQPGGAIERLVAGDDDVIDAEVVDDGRA